MKKIVELKVGDRVREKSCLHPITGRCATGTVTDIIPHSPLLPVEEHGTVTVVLDFSGIEEHYSEYQWYKFLEIIK